MAEVRAEMVANVWKVVVAEGAGTVSSLAVSEGDVVQEGDVIAVIS